jgi:hypothetical protein
MGRAVTSRIGYKRERLEVLSYVGNTVAGRDTIWLCKCTCGNLKEMRWSAIKIAISCGCWRKEKPTTHGQTSSREYKAWCDAKGRCRPDSPKRKHYYDRGIRMCEEWEADFETFLLHMGPCPAGHTLDRKNNDRNYEPDNCRWATHKVQCNNRTSNTRVTLNGVTRTLQEWSDLVGIKAGTISYRLRIGWSPKDALNPSISLAAARRISIGRRGRSCGFGVIRK